MNPKKQKFLDNLQKNLEGGAVQPEELMQVTDALVAIIKKTNESFATRLDSTTVQLSDEIQASLDEIKRTEESIKELISQTDGVSRQDIQSLITQLSKELKNVEGKIPTIPEQQDLTEILDMLKGHGDSLTNLSNLISGENIRNALEAIPDEEEKLAISAIGNLRKELDALEKKVRQSSNKLDTYGGGVGAIKESNGWTNGSITTYNKLTVSATEPVNPREGDLWCDVS